MAELAITPKRKNKVADRIPDKISYIKSEARDRKVSILYLIHSYLIDQKLFQTSEVLEKESLISEQYQICENVDLDIIFQEFQSYYYTKFQKYPKILKKCNESALKLRTEKSHSGNTRSNTPAKIEKNNSSDNDEFNFEIVSYPQPLEVDESQKLLSEKLLYNMAEYVGEYKELANQIMKECFVKNLQSKWSDCIGLENVIEKFKEAIIYPLKYPNIFKNIETWKGVLLFGPPGTGKTLLAKALASENITFLNVCNSTMTSKWRGESEKMLKILFDLAKCYAPTTIFIDEIDSLICSPDPKHDASKRFRSEFLTQVDGILSNNEKIFLVGCTNLPWNIDAAILRRFEKRLLVTLPNRESRIKLFKHFLPKPNNISENEFVHLANLTENFSGSDVKNFCKEASMFAIREKLNELKTRSKPNEHLRNITYHDMEQALEKVSSCTTINEINMYYEWNKRFSAL